MTEGSYGKEWHWQRSWDRDWWRGGIPKEPCAWVSHWGPVPSPPWSPWDIALNCQEISFLHCPAFLLELISALCRLINTPRQEGHNKWVKGNREQTLEYRAHSFVIFHPPDSPFIPLCNFDGEKVQFTQKEEITDFVAQESKASRFSLVCQTWLLLRKAFKLSSVFCKLFGTLIYYITLCFIKIFFFPSTSEAFFEGRISGGLFWFITNVI